MVLRKHYRRLDRPPRNRYSAGMLTRVSLACQVLAFLIFTAVASAENWPQWRGPRSDGTSLEAGLPVEWSETANIAWKTALTGMGTSTPIIWGDHIFLTSQLGDGPSAGGTDFDKAREAKSAGNRKEVTFLVSAYVRADGKLLWEKSFAAANELPAVHIKHNLASPSCVTDGELVYAWFGNGLAVALDFDGALVWKRNLGEERAGFDVRWGHGSSPALYEDSLFLLVDHPGDSYLLSVDKRTGKDRWRADRGEEKRSYTTPFVVPGPDGDQIVINTNHGVEALRAVDGSALWRVGESNRVPVSTPVFHQGVIYSSRGHFSGPYLAVGVAGKGDVGESQLKWRVGTGAPYVGSLVYANGILFMATERGIASAVDAETGETLWKQRLGGVFTASPVVAAGKVYLFAEDGNAYVVAAPRKFELLAQNALGERVLASPAVSGGHMYIRSDQHLFAIAAD